MEYIVKDFCQDWSKQSFSSFVMGIDIGGTETNIGIAGVQNLTPILLFSLNFRSNKLNSLIPAVQQTLRYAKDHYDISVGSACIGAAGMVSSFNDSVQLTNLPWNVTSNELIQETSLESVYIINDFQAIGYGLNLLHVNNHQDIFQVRSGTRDAQSSKATKVIIGAGTGFGKTILTYDEHVQAYIPIPSEGGHADLVVHNEFEMHLVAFIKKLRGIDQPLNYEEVLSGRGLEAIYAFFRYLNQFPDSIYTKEIDNASDKAPLISTYKEVDETCKETFHLFTRFYGRCAKNYVLETLARGGLYIAGGIANKNIEIFKSKEFLEEFDYAYRRSDFLKSIPLFVILNYDVSLYGTCFAAMYYVSNK